jgi:hypothetical protein
MGGKNNQTASGNLTTLRRGGRVRCTDDGVEGRITWANGVSVKIEWVDGEKVTWRRDSLADRPIEILDADGDDPVTAPSAAPQLTAAASQGAGETTATTEQRRAEPEATANATAQPQAEQETTLATAESPAPELAAPVSEATAEQAAPVVANAAAPSAAKPKRQRKASTEPKEKKASALDAAARVLAEEGRPLTCQELIDAMAARGYWSSPNGKTPAATLYSALQRELQTKGATARFRKAERGKFALAGTA